MSKSTVRGKRCDQRDLNRKFEEASRQWEAGKLRSAFRLFLIAAKSGDQGAQLNLGNFYSDGIGVRLNREKALHWYRRAYRQGYAAAASNIGVLFRNDNRLKQAIKWFERAVELGDGDANLEIAKVHIQSDERAKAIQFLKRTLRVKPGYITEGSREEAQGLLKELGKPGKPGDRKL